MPQTTPPAAARPDSVRLAEMALAAGFFGERLTLRFRDYPPHTLARLWEFISRCVAAKTVVAVNGAGDLAKVRRAPRSSRLILVRNPRLDVEVAWALKTATMKCKPDKDWWPTVFTSAQVDSDLDPGATLVLHPHPAEIKHLDAFLAVDRGSNSDSHEAARPKPELVRAVRAVFDQHVAPALPRSRDREVVRGLWAGALLLTPNDARPSAWLAAAYAEAHHCLRVRTARPTDELFDPLAVAMVARANTYLRSRPTPQGAGKVVSPEDTDPAGRGVAGAAHGGITRQELTELGASGSTRVADLIRTLVDAGDFGAFVRLGLKPAQNPPRDWPAQDVAGLAPLLLEWSYKQIRTHFEPLMRSGLIEGVRPKRNGAMVYTHLEGLAGPSTAFDRLPAPDALAALLAIPEVSSACGLPHLPVVCPPAGQTEPDTP